MAKVLIEKYAAADSVNRKIKILEQNGVITLILTNGHILFALEEAPIMEDLPDLT